MILAISIFLSVTVNAQQNSVVHQLCTKKWATPPVGANALTNLLQNVMRMLNTLIIKLVHAYACRDIVTQA